MKAVSVAADTNLLRHPTPRRYITTIEALRSRPIVILPSVNRELYKHLSIQAGEHIDRMARHKGLGEDERIEESKTVAAAAALQWWRGERERNDSVYLHVPEQKAEDYAATAARLPGEAFTDDNDTDRWIYAEAMVHGVDVLASRNRNTILIEVLEEYFAARGQPTPPVAVRSLWEHTAAVAKAERYAITEVAMETMLCAIIPDGWTASTNTAAALKWSGERFIKNLRTREHPRERPDPEREKLGHLLHRTLSRMGQARLLGRANARTPHSRGCPTSRDRARCATTQSRVEQCERRGWTCGRRKPRGDPGRSMTRTRRPQEDPPARG